MAGKFHIAFVRYLNTRPLIEGLESLADVELIAAAPAEIAGLVRSGRVDIGLGSIIDAVGSAAAGGKTAVGSGGGAQNPLAVVPAGMIGCDGLTLTVRLYASVPFSQITRVHVDIESHTSVVLCQILLDRVYGVQPEIVSFDASLLCADEQQSSATAQGLAAAEGDWPEAVLLIGDKVVTDAPPAAQYRYQLDLGESWKTLMGLPFVYASWLCRAEDARSTRIRAIGALLERQLLHNLSRLDWIITSRAVEHGWTVELARHYVGHLLRYRFGRAQRKAAERFIIEAARLGLVDADAALVWAPWPKRPTHSRQADAIARA